MEERHILYLSFKTTFLEHSDASGTKKENNFFSCCSASRLTHAILETDLSLGLSLRLSFEYINTPLPLDRPCRGGSVGLGVGGMGACVGSSIDRLS